MVSLLMRSCLLVVVDLSIHSSSTFFFALGMLESWPKDQRREMAKVGYKIVFLFLFFSHKCIIEMRYDI